jgi:hypothetical protein
MAKTTKNKKTTIKKPTYMRGIIGSFIGGMIASIPWIWIYVYGQEIYTIFALIIATGALIGYQLFKGKVDKKLPFILSFGLIIFISPPNKTPLFSIQVARAKPVGVVSEAGIRTSP